MSAKPIIYIVSGLPRSGTSMMMRALAEGGLPPFTDNRRTADSDNPNGYYENDSVLKTASDCSWCLHAEGHVVKLVYALLYKLPLDYQYRVVVMRRDMDEIIASQNKMLDRLGHDNQVPDEVIKKLFIKELEKFHVWVEQQTHIVREEIEYRDVVAKPFETLARVRELLGVDLNLEKMVGTIDPSLYRNRTLSL